MKKSDTPKKPEESLPETVAQQAGDDHIALLAKEIEAWKQKYLRALADYQNLEKRSREQVEEGRKFAAELVLVRFLSVLDTFERAQAHLADAGLGYALKEFYAALSEKGVQKLEVVGKPFNPHEMECIEVVSGREGIVENELEPGYRLNGKIIRVAKVQVGKTMPNAK